MAHQRPESTSSAGLHHTRAKEGEEMEGEGGGGGGGGGGGVGGANERSWPINGLKCLFNGWFEKKKGKLMVGAENKGFAADGR